MLSPTVTELVTSSEVDVESGATVMLSTGLTELFSTEPAVGVKTAVSCAVDAANDVEHATVALWPLGVTARFAHPLIGVPPSSKVTAPHSAVLLLAPDVTVAMSVTVSLVTALPGDASSAAVVACEARGVGAATTATVVLLFAEVFPPRPLAVTTQTIVCPMSAAESVYLLDVAPAIGAQLVPVLLHSSHT